MAQIFPLPEGLFTVGHDKQLVPFTDGKDELNDRPVGSLLVEIQPFLVVTDKDVIIFDTGLGIFDNNGELRIHNNIRNCGYEPHQITKVCLSHLHKDHAGCLVYTAADGILRATFPDATYYIYRPEADYALKTGYPSYFTADLEAAFSNVAIHWLDGEAGDIDGYIHFSHSGAHCPQHIVYLIDDGMDKVFFGGDEAPQLKQMLLKYVAKYDYNGKKALELREMYAQQGREDGWKFLFYHDAKSPISVLERP